MRKLSPKCLMFNKLFSCFVFYILLQKIPTIATYNVSEDFDIDLKLVEKMDISSYVYPFIPFLNLSGINVASKKTVRDINSKSIFPIESKNSTEKLKELESSEKIQEKDINLSQELKKSLSGIQPRSESLKKNGDFLMNLLFKFYITPILTFYRPLLNEEVKYYKKLINVNEEISDDTNILSSLLYNVIQDNNNYTHNNSKMHMKINDTELKDSNFLLSTTTAPNFTDFITENDSVLQITSRWKDIFELTMKDETKTITPSKLEMTTDRNLDNLLKAEIFFKPVEPSTSTELPKLSFTNNTAILTLFRPGEIPIINIKKDPNSAVSFKMNFPLVMNHTDEMNNTTLEIPISRNSNPPAQEIHNSSMSTSDSQTSTTISSVHTNLNESDAVQPKILYSAKGSMIPGLLKITTTTTNRPPVVLKVASRDHYKSRMEPVFSSQYSAKSTTNISIIEKSSMENENISATNESLINDTLIPDSQKIENATESNSFADNSLVNSTVASVSEGTTLAFSKKITHETETKKDVKNVKKRELPISYQYDVNDRQELASYFYNGKKIHESYFNYANSIDHELPPDWIQYQDKFGGKTNLNSLGKEVINHINQENSQNLNSGYNFQQKHSPSVDDLFPNSDLKNYVEQDVLIPEKETSTVPSIKNNTNITIRKNKKNILNRKKVNSRRKNNKNSRLKNKNNKLTKGKRYRHSRTGKKKNTKKHSTHKNVKARSNIKKRTRKIKNKISNQVRSKKKNMHKPNDNIKLKDLY